MSLFLVEHEPDAVADTRSTAVARSVSDIEAEAEAFECQAAELRKSAERLYEKAHHLRVMARRLRGDLRTSTSESNDCVRLRRLTDSHSRGQEDLTRRQREIVGLIASGRTNRQIAEELVVTVGTVANHVAQILDRLGLENRVQLAAWAIEHRRVWHDRTMPI